MDSLRPFAPTSDRPWNELRIKHLYRRLSFGASRTALRFAASKSPSQLVDELIDAGLTAPLSATPAWSNWDFRNYQNLGNDEVRDDRINQDIFGWLKEWMKDMRQYDTRGKFILFWHNHFVTQLETFYFPRYLYEYHRLLQSNALGNFKEFVNEMGKSTAMLLFLNGVESTKYEPNENYARELYELFSLGRDQGYTQRDIEETARALTGWNNLEQWGRPITFNSIYFDNGQKTIFGQTGNWGYDDVTNILFEQRGNQIAQFVCQKIYTSFVNPQANEAIISQMATTLIASNWEIIPVLRQLFKSEHFFDEANIGIQVKSPYELFFNFFKEIDFRTNDEDLDGVNYFTSMLGQQLASPVDVAGWQGNRTWLDTARISGRWRTLSWVVYWVMDRQPEKLTELAVNLAGSFAIRDPAIVAQKVVDYFLPIQIHTPEVYERATQVFKADIPSNYFDDGSWNLNWDTVPWQMTLLLQYLIKLPEFQLT